MIKFLTTKLYFYNLIGVGLYKNKFETDIYNHKQIETYYLLWSEANLKKMNKQKKNEYEIKTLQIRKFRKEHYLYNIYPIINNIKPLYNFANINFMCCLLSYL
jgi:hypothetical protein